MLAQWTWHGNFGYAILHDFPIVSNAERPKQPASALKMEWQLRTSSAQHDVVIGGCLW